MSQWGGGGVPSLKASGEKHGRGWGGQVALQFPSSETLPMPSGLGCNRLLLL